MVIIINRCGYNRYYYLNICKNIVRKNDGYILEKVYEEDNNGEVKETEANKNNLNYNQSTKVCSLCLHHMDDCCRIYSKLAGCPKNQFALCHFIYKCDAYEPIYSLNVIESKDDMVNFIIKVEDIFNDSEIYEEYFGFERNYDELTGNILETTKEYYERGGTFEHIPDKYPCVINFQVSEDMDKQHWIYIGD